VAPPGHRRPAYQRNSGRVTTAYDQHAIQAFTVNALDYLLKPIAPQRLVQALARVPPRQTPTRRSQVFVREGERCWIVSWQEIYFLESEGNYTRVHFAAERPLIRRSLQSLEQQLDSAQFFRANRKQLVNLCWVERTDLGVRGELTARLRGGQIVELSRRQSDRLRALMSL